MRTKKEQQKIKTTSSKKKQAQAASAQKTENISTNSKSPIKSSGETIHGAIILSTIFLASAK
jgi:hypothetical protein